MGPSGRELEFIIRFKEQASAALDRVRDKLRLLGSTTVTQRKQMREAGKAMEEMAKKGTLFAQGAERMDVSARKAAGGINKLSAATKRAGKDAGFFRRNLAKLGFNFNKVEKDAKKAGDKTDKFGGFMKNTTKSVQLALGPLSGISARLTAFTGIVQQATFKIAFFATALVGMVAIGAAARSAAKEIDKTFKASQRLGFSFEKFQELEFIASQSGVNAEQFSKGLEALATRISDASAGAGEAKKTFKALGLETRTLVNDLPIEQFEKVRAGLNKITNETDRAAAVSKIFSRANVPLANMLRLTGKEFDALAKQARDFGLILSTKVAQDAVKATDAMDLLVKVLDKNFKRVLAQLFPSITKLSLFIAKIGPLVKDNADIIIAALTGIAVLLTGPFLFAVTGPFALPLTAGFALLAAAAVFAFTNLDLVIEKLKDFEKIKFSAVLSVLATDLVDFVKKTIIKLGGLTAIVALKLFDPDEEEKRARKVVQIINKTLAGIELRAALGKQLLLGPGNKADPLSGFNKAIKFIREQLQKFKEEADDIIKSIRFPKGTDKFVEQFEKLRDTLRLQKADLSFITNEFDRLGDNFEEAATQSRLFAQALALQSSIMAATGVSADRFPPMGGVMKILAGDMDTFTSATKLTKLELKNVLELLILIRDVEGNKAVRASQLRIQGLLIEGELLNVRLRTFGMTADEQERALVIRETELRLIASGIKRGTERFNVEVKITEEIIRREQALRKLEAARDSLTAASERGLQDIGQAFTDVFLDAEKGFADLEDVATKVFKKITDMVIQLTLINPLINKAGFPGGGNLPSFDIFGAGLKLLSGLGGSSVSGGSVADQSAGSVFSGTSLIADLFAKGGVVDSLRGIKDSIANQNIKRAARGTILTEPTFIKAGNDIVQAREAGQDEGILPLRRMRSGDLGVSANIATPAAQSLNVNVFQTIKSDNPTTFQATLSQQLRLVKRATDRAFARG